MLLASAKENQIRNELPTQSYQGCILEQLKLVCENGTTERNQMGQKRLQLEHKQPKISKNQVLLQYQSSIHAKRNLK